MAWREILKATSEAEAREAKPAIADIPAGSEVQINIDLPWYAPAGKLADLAGMEFWAQKLYSEMQVVDVEGNWHYIIIHGKAKGAFPIAIALIVFGVLAAVGLTTFATVTIYSNITEQQTIAAERERAKIEITEKLLDMGHPLGEITAWLEGIKTPPPEVQSIIGDIAKPLGISAGIILVGLVLLFFIGRGR